jgi:hypothetical protein
MARAIVGGWPALSSHDQLPRSFTAQRLNLPDGSDDPTTQ